MRLIGIVVLVAGCSFAPSGGGTPADASDDGALPPIDGGDTDAMAPDGSDGPPRTSFVAEAEAFSAKTDAAKSWTSTTQLAGFSGAAYMQCGTGNGAFCPNDAGLDTCAASMDYTFVIDVPGTYHIHARMLATGSADDSAYYGLDGTAAPDDLAPPQDAQWTWETGGTPIAIAAGTHVLTIWQRECGARVDVVAVTDSAQPPP